MQFVSRERRSFIVGTTIEREREISLETQIHRHVATPLDGWLHLGENAIWNSAHFPVCRSSSRFRGSLPNVRTRKYLPLIKFTPRNAPTSLPPLSHDATPPSRDSTTLFARIHSLVTYFAPLLVCARALTSPLHRTPSLSGSERKENRQDLISIECLTENIENSS